MSARAASREASRTLLHVAASSRGGASHSRAAGHHVLARLQQALGPLRVLDCDLGAMPPPHPDARMVEASLTPAQARSPAAEAALAASEQWIGQLEAADLVLLSTPVHNFTVPSALKAWIDHVVRPGRTFLSTPAGKVGLLADRPVLVVAAAGGAFEAGPGSQVDFLSPYLRAVFGCMGLTQVEVLRLENLRREPAAIEAARARLDDWSAAVAARLAAGAAGRD
ncbi:FMN-dependent NADH-azoreductase [Cupriavidus malaysiensis]|uniref:FMN dependent NADH:quinone oxidoreductase n=1 Tax=Cupriavidus malaysiensis TaxID=367825 RepID=A0ABM6F059_9BURK|nr:NAD(P)H-dependent oxidoreductase [Cupriavidus malaysiensis]AOZ04447.1 FMN-dependent NADH-azoreductase [Cupriavidus malaysiensis]